MINCWKSTFRIPGPTYELGPRPWVLGPTFRVPGHTYEMGPGSWVSGPTNSPKPWVLLFRYAVCIVGN